MTTDNDTQGRGNPDELDRWLDELLAELSDEECEECGGVTPEEAWPDPQTPDPRTEELLALLDGPFKVLRDDTFCDPSRLLVYDPERAPLVQALTFNEATVRYKCGVGGRWTPECVEKIKKDKRECLAETLDSYYKREQGDEESDLPCSTPCLVVRGASFPHSWVTVRAFLE